MEVKVVSEMLHLEQADRMAGEHDVVIEFVAPDAPKEND